MRMVDLALLGYYKACLLRQGLTFNNGQCWLDNFRKAQSCNIQFGYLEFKVLFRKNNWRLLLKCLLLHLFGDCELRPLGARLNLAQPETYHIQFRYSELHWGF